ncbi:hypothetical protein KGM_214521 [Danaus plexippus plexippus]|uniref:Uncharacterized protein n=1 Tax=Danaus plexippus plexippus TaxID=278856 RepID=A0A212F4R9_DANPL|nr:uncharacterized protein LOC116769659 [Danaus plexippus plexippus]OWR48720.1 hypothetical protein KGM_214521 [Danaus plexippus plexippus]
MGCGSSGHVVEPERGDKTGTDNARNGTNGHGTNGLNHHNDDVPTVLLPETPIKPKPPVAYEIPLEEFDGARRLSPPPHLQRLLQQPAPDISLPDIEEKLAEAEQRRLMILQQRAASAQKKTQGMMKAFENGNNRNQEDTKQAF